ncbi:Zn(2)-Cys(6) binuclear cluster domain-containing protein [Mycena sanguinolenta]|uniref:Zn(2)-Cys(6) binuclear cluster domain-containing protein n=1 Tax=Mycena sanguinolenta TaxID=230812 RepID=A0A8H7DB32_9AGAR|nr:Zn(2)-Cys(6) binuclear cluster domain-containing protein [Mycena sanguinolenta]
MAQHFFSSSPTAHSPRSNLPRGKACMNCRRRKIKCDGRKPVCSQCARSPGTADDCEYPLEGRSRTQHLEETIKKLQSRIGELEASANDHQSGILLHEPYDGGVGSGLSLEIPPQYIESWTPSPNTKPFAADVSITTSPSSRVNTPSSASSESTLVLEEPPPHLTEQLVDAFLSTFTPIEFFFLHAASFRHSALQPFPFGHYERPSPALLSAVYMWGARLSASQGDTPRHPVYNQEAFLVCTLQNIHQDLAGNHPQRVMHAIQAEILLSMYYLTLGRPVEGAYHSSAAVSLAISANLHLIKSSRFPASLQPCFGVLETPLPPPVDTREESERIRAFWTTVIVNNYWRAAHASPSAISYLDTPIETPWPRELESHVSNLSPGFGARAELNFSPSDSYNSSPSATSYHSRTNSYSSSPSRSTSAPLPEYLFDAMGTAAVPGGNNAGGSTVTNFLAGLNLNMDGGDGFSPLALLAKASILLERAITLSSRCPSYSDPASAPEFDSLDALLSQFVHSLPLGLDFPQDETSAPTKRSLLLVTHTLTHTAIIRLHAGRIHTSNVSRSKYIAAARAVVHSINSTDFSNLRHIDPIMGILWTTASEVFIGELSRIQQQRAFEFGVGLTPTQQHQEQELTTCLETLLATMRGFAQGSPLIEYFSTRLEEAFRAVAGVGANGNDGRLSLSPPPPHAHAELTIPAY